jgi:hypothetical protein
MSRTRRRSAAMLAGLALCATSVVVPASLGAIHVGPGKGNPQTNPTGKCPPGQNSDTSPGGLKKCP